MWDAGVNIEISSQEHTTFLEIELHCELKRIITNLKVLCSFSNFIWIATLWLPLSLSVLNIYMKTQGMS